MAEIQTEVETRDKDIGKYAKHPLRTMGGAFLVGTAVGVGVTAAKKHSRRNSLQKFLDQLNR